MTVPRATPCNLRVAPGRLSPAAHSGRGNPDPPTGATSGRTPWQAPTRAHRRARRPRARFPVPSVPTVVGVADPRRPSHPRCPAGGAAVTEGVP